jgi:hypothetical protein
MRRCRMRSKSTQGICQTWGGRSASGRSLAKASRNRAGEGGERRFGEEEDLAGGMPDGAVPRFREGRPGRFAPTGQARGLKAHGNQAMNVRIEDQPRCVQVCSRASTPTVPLRHGKASAAAASACEAGSFFKQGPVLAQRVPVEELDAVMAGPRRTRSVQPTFARRAHRLKPLPEQCRHRAEEAGIVGEQMNDRGDG